MSTIRSFRFIKKCIPALIGLFCLAGFAVGQTTKDTTKVADKPEVSIELTYTASNNHSKILTATVKTKVEGSYQAVNGLNVYFYQTEATPGHLLGNVTSNNKGIAIFEVPQAKLAKDSAAFTFIAAVENSDKFEDNQEEVAVSEAEFTMNLTEEDSTRQVTVSLQTKDASGKMMPVKEIEVHFYVQRMFGLLPLAENPETTDENGEASIEFPAGIPGDTAGNLIIVAKVEDNERFGNLEFRRKINWGTPLVVDPNINLRQLWSSRANAPYYLIIIVNTMLIGIWGVIFYIIYQVFLIKKLGRKSIA